MPISMIHTQHTSAFPHYAPSLAPPPSSNLSLPYTSNLHQQPAKNPPSFSSAGGYISTPTSKEDTTHRYHLLSSHEHNTNLPKNQYDTHGTAPLKHTINSDLDIPTLNGNYHQPCSHPLYNPNSNNNNNITGSHPHHSSAPTNYSPPHTNNYSHTNNDHASNYPTMTSFTNSHPFLTNSPPLVPPHYQLATENAIPSYTSAHPSATGPQTSQSTIDISSLDRRPWSNHTRGWPTQAPLSTASSPPAKAPSPPPSTSQTSAAPPPAKEPTRNASPTRSASRPIQSLPHTLPLPKLHTSLPSPTGSSPPASSIPPPLSPPSSPGSNSSSPPSSPRGTKRRRSDQERREKHNDTERKGRQKINSEIRVLKSLLPELQNSAAPKVSVLQCAVDTLKRRTEYATSVQQQNAHLRDENKSLKAEIVRLQHLLSMTSSPPNQALPLHLHSVSSSSSTPVHHSSAANNLHQPLDTLDHNKRHDGFPFPGPLAPSASLIPPAKQWY